MAREFINIFKSHNENEMNEWDGANETDFIAYSTLKWTKKQEE